MLKSLRSIAVLGIAVACTTAAWSGEYEVMQKNKHFSVDHLKVKVGDTVKFVNEDPFSHNIFSLSDAKSFDLGSMTQGGSKSVTFDKPGTVLVECAVHPDMKLTIEVAP